MDGLAGSFARELLRPRRYNYSQEPLEDFLLADSETQCHHFRIPNPRGHLLETLILRKNNPKACIVYAHGLGSNKLEGLSVAKYFLKYGYDLCSFDFSGSGRSEGDCTTYGLYEKDDILAVLKHLEATESYSKIVFWGRSMGAVAMILAHEQQNNPKVECLVLDSPFSSFEKIAIEIAAKKSFIPQFMLSVLMEPLKDYFRQSEDPNPFGIDIQKAITKIDTPILLIYSPNDSIVSCAHSKHLISLCRKNPAELVINEDHNMQRSKSTMQKTLHFIQDSQRSAERKAMFSRCKSRGISVTSKDNKDRESIRSISKLKLVNVSSNHLSAVELTARQSSKSKASSRHIHTVQSLSSSLNESAQYRKRIDSESSPQKRKRDHLSSVFVETRLPEHRLLSGSNKQNMKPALNLLRKNRFR